MQYGVNIKKLDNGQFECSCPDIPECVFEDDTLEELYKTAGHALPACLHLFYKSKKIAIPLPKATDCQHYVYVPARVQAKILLWNYMVENRYRTSDLARILECSFSQAKRIIDITQDGASIETIENALRKLGAVFNVSVVNKK